MTLLIWIRIYELRIYVIHCIIKMIYIWFNVESFLVVAHTGIQHDVCKPLYNADYPSFLVNPWQPSGKAFNLNIFSCKVFLNLLKNKLGTIHQSGRTWLQGKKSHHKSDVPVGVWRKSHHKSDVPVGVWRKSHHKSDVPVGVWRKSHHKSDVPVGVWRKSHHKSDVPVGVWRKSHHKSDVPVGVWRKSHHKSDVPVGVWRKSHHKSDVPVGVWRKSHHKSDVPVGVWRWWCKE